jgi:hypothetical protein
VNQWPFESEPSPKPFLRLSEQRSTNHKDRILLYALPTKTVKKLVEGPADRFKADSRFYAARFPTVRRSRQQVFGISLESRSPPLLAVGQHFCS